MKSIIRKKRRILTVIISVLTSLCILLSGYIALLYVNIPYVTQMRNLWIETAMTTFEHQWLATAFFPGWLIDSVTSNQFTTDDVITITDIIEPAKEKNEDILNQKSLTVGKKDPQGNEVIVNDIEQGIVIVKVEKSSFVGRIAFIDDPSRVFLGVTDKIGSYGLVICDYLKKYDAICGINASGFEDAGGHGKGGVVNGLCYYQGKSWGTNNGGTSVCFDKNNRLIVGALNDWDKNNVRDGIQFSHPVLIANGVQLMKTNNSNGNGYGIQPRTVIAQRADGVVMFMVVDGRQPGYSIGAKLSECADVLMTYGAVTAGACDGGSSSVIAYNGKLLNSNSSGMKSTGRYLPNAFLVRKK